MEELRPVAVGITVVADIAVVTGTVGINIAVRIGIGIQPGNTAVEVRRPTDLLYKISLNFVPKESNRFFRIIHPVPTLRFTPFGTSSIFLKKSPHLILPSVNRFLTRY